MQMTRALRRLMHSHDRDIEFDYLGFLGAFAMVERWASDADEDTMAAFLAADVDRLLGMSLGQEQGDRKLTYILRLIRSHGEEVYQQQQSAPILN